MGHQSNRENADAALVTSAVVFFCATLLINPAWEYFERQSPLRLAPQLESAYAGSDLQKKMISKGVSDYSLFCDSKSSKLGLHLQFTRDSGIGNTKVIGDTDCSKKGMVVGRRHWLIASGLHAAGSYDPSTFMAELTGLFERSRPLLEQANGADPVLAKAFEADYGEMATQQGLSQVRFHCDDAGDEFDVVAVFRAGAQYTKETEVSIKCERDGQAFTVSLLGEGETPTGPRTKYAQRNGVSLSLANAAYGEYLRQNRPRSKF